MSDDWRIEINAEDYFGHKQKKLEVADRRPVIRKSSDLAGMGPGFNATCVPITDFNDLIALYDGYYSATLAYNGPFPDGTGPDVNKDPRSYVGIVVSDGEIGGYQQFTHVPDDLITSKAGRTYRREFRRAESDPDYIDWGPWYVEGSRDEPIGTVKMSHAIAEMDGWLRMDGSAFNGSDYPELAALLGATSTPDMRARFPFGGSPGFEGVTGGSGYVAPHTHTFAHLHGGATHSHSISPAGSVSIREATAETSSGTVSVANAGHAHGSSTGTETGVTSQPAPDDITEANAANTDVQLPPYLILPFWIKATHLY